MTNTQIKLVILKEQLDLDPEFRQAMIAYAALEKEFGQIKPPVYLQEKLDNIDLLVKARMNSKLLQ